MKGRRSKRRHLKSKSYEYSGQEAQLSMFPTVIPPATSFSGCKLAIQEHLQYKQKLTLSAPYFTIRNGGRKSIGPKAILQSLRARVYNSEIMNQIQNLIIQSGTLTLKIYSDVKLSFGMLLSKFLLAALTSKK